jgi:hypothetical protein
MTYTAETIKIAKTYNIDERDVFFCHLIASGCNRGESYYTIYEHGGKASRTYTAEQANAKATEFLKNHPGLTVLISRLKTKRSLNTADANNQVKSATSEEIESEDVKKFNDKSYIIKSLAHVSRELSGKEKAQVLMQIADLQRMKSEETKEKEEVRRFYLPYVSRCRGCKVLQLISGVLEGEKMGEKEG